MKTIKKTIFSAIILCLVINLSSAQQMYWVHQDNVKPSTFMEYEKIAKEFNAACVEYNFQGKWLTTTMDDFRYLYVSPIENFATLDERPFADMAKAMGEDFGKLFERFDQCYDSHFDYIIVLSNELSYMPDGITQTQEGQDYRDFYFIHYLPKDHQKIKEGMQAVKEMYTSKGSKNHYRVYHSGFGAAENYYMVAMSSKDAIDSATKSEENKKLLGPERYDTFMKVMNYATKVEEVTGEIRRDLSYSPKE
ncbi:hypothetical protein [Seonamhaeicola aphaedonensis]|uniref:NIPSNAP protein n=1 Tax=Seonamhaeicola aphaedonensis TaxID=1461338 RepID=A0A3D9HIN5_9FLAO|nr:hypothetical protein [Seonamhaeicola aphaedonensis]RED49323.1 hypothetical protein DFQ02_10289 [Seonamhaeicola aphaedonensis]